MVTTQVPQRRSTRSESPTEEVSYFYQQLAGLLGVPTTNAKLFVQGTANFPLRGKHSTKIMQYIDIVS